MRLRTLPLYSLAVSAGTGQFLDGEDYEMVEVGQEVPEGSNFGVRVAGDSMEPEFHDGQTVWVRQQRSLMTGDIGIFLYDGSAYLKQARGAEGFHGAALAEPRVRGYRHLARAAAARAGQGAEIIQPPNRTRSSPYMTLEDMP